MNKLLKILIFSIAVLGAGFLFASPVNAQPLPLVVQFQPNPLFNQANFLPGDTVTGSATVTNNSGQSQRIGTQAINVSDLDDLGDVMYLEIKQGSNPPIYTGTLSAFFAAGEIYLSDLANGANTTYNYSVTFNLGAGDEYQGLGLGFDIAVGFLGESISQQVSSEGGTSGSGTFTGGLIISNEAIEIIGPDSVTITWDTNLNSTSRVIYSPSPAPVFNINNPPNYGYAQSTIEDTNKILHHSVTIIGLTPATTYFFRCVSHNSPDTLSPEYSFATLNPGETPTENEQQLGEQMGEVAGAAIIRTALPDTGGILGKIAKNNEFKINLIIGAGLIFIWIVLILIRLTIKKGEKIHPVK